jgi:hypothetical protein
LEPLVLLILIFSAPLVIVVKSLESFLRAFISTFLVAWQYTGLTSSLVASELELLIAATGTVASSCTDLTCSFDQYLGLSDCSDLFDFNFPRKLRRLARKTYFVACSMELRNSDCFIYFGFQY